MEYIINGLIKYNPLKRTLYSIEHKSDEIILARITNILLLLFIENNNNLLSREYLLREIWEKQGLDSSNNNLNNYVSMLRKALMQCGCIEIINTVPKYGFIFNGNIEAIAAKEIPSPLYIAGREKTANKEKTNITKPKEMSRILPIVIIAIISIIPFSYEKYRLSTVRHEIFHIEKCSFYIADDDTRTLETTTGLITRIKSLARQEALRCQEQANIYYFAQSERDATGKRLTNELLSYCPAGNKAACYNHWFVERKN